MLDFRADEVRNALEEMCEIEGGLIVGYYGKQPQQSAPSGRAQGLLQRRGSSTHGSSSAEDRSRWRRLLNATRPNLLASIHIGRLSQVGSWIASQLSLPAASYREVFLDAHVTAQMMSLIHTVWSRLTAPLASNPQKVTPKFLEMQVFDESHGNVSALWARLAVDAGGPHATVSLEQFRRALVATALESEFFRPREEVNSLGALVAEYCRQLESNLLTLLSHVMRACLCFAVGDHIRIGSASAGAGAVGGPGTGGSSMTAVSPAVSVASSLSGVSPAISVDSPGAAGGMAAAGNGFLSGTIQALEMDGSVRIAMDEAGGPLFSGAFSAVGPAGVAAVSSASSVSSPAAGHGGMGGQGTQPRTRTADRAEIRVDIPHYAGRDPLVFVRALSGAGTRV